MSSMLYVMIHFGSSVVTARLIHDRLDCAPVCGSHTPRCPRTSGHPSSVIAQWTAEIGLSFPV